MLAKRSLTLVVGLLSFTLTSATQAGAQTTIGFTEFPVNTQTSEQYVNKGVLFSSPVGTPIISKDNLITGKVGLCALGHRTMGRGIFAVKVNACETVYV